jgi:hypothetical protein
LPGRYLNLALVTYDPTDQKDYVHCIAPHPEFDQSGKTIPVTWTDANVIYAVKVTRK